MKLSDFLHMKTKFSILGATWAQNSAHLLSFPNISTIKYFLLKINIFLFKKKIA